jgi:type IV pilus assembly protein PilN
MIRINLQTEKKKKKKKIKGPANFTVAFAVVTVTTLIVMGAVFFFMKSAVSKLKAESESNKGKIAALKKKMDEVKKYEKLNKEIEQRNNLIEGLRKNQSVPIKILDLVSMAIPEGVWLDAMTFRDNAVSIEGHAFSNPDIVTYIDNLKRMQDFTDVYLDESREAEIEKVKVYKFKLNFRVKV